MILTLVEGEFRLEVIYLNFVESMLNKIKTNTYK